MRYFLGKLIATRRKYRNFFSNLSRLAINSFFIASVAMFFGKSYRNSKEISQFFFKSFATCDKLVFYRKYFDEIVKYRKRSFFCLDYKILADKIDIT